MVHGISWSPSGRAAAIAGPDEGGTIWLLDTNEARPLSSVGTMSAIDWSADRRFVASGTLEGRTAIHDPSTGDLLVWGGGLLYTDAVSTIRFSRDAGLVAAGFYEGALRVFRGRSLDPVAELLDHTSNVRCIAWSPDGRHLVSGSNDHTVRFWDTSTWQCVGGLTDHTKAVSDVRFSSDGRYLVSASIDSTVRIWDLAQNRYVAVLDAVDGWGILGCDYAPDERHLACLGSGGNLDVWDLVENRLKARIDAGFLQSTMAWSPDGRHIAVGGTNAALQLWDCANELTGRPFPASNGGLGPPPTL